MTPTPRLRFVEREIEPDPFYRAINALGQPVVSKYTVLQQWCVDADAVFDTVTKDIRGEWRDVPLEKEQ